MWNKPLLIAGLLLPALVAAQYKDAGLWAGYSFSADLGKLELGIAPEIRLDENISRMATFFADVSAQYKITKQFSVAATYRGGGRNTEDFIEPRQRIQLGLGYREKWSDFTVALQSRWQAAVTGFGAESDVDFVTILRNKFKVQYGGLKKTDLATSFEIFNLTTLAEPLLLRSWRWAAEVERSLNKRHSVALGYLIQKDLLSSPNEMDFVILVSYQMKLDFGKKKKNKEKDAPENLPAPGR